MPKPVVGQLEIELTAAETQRAQSGRRESVCLSQLSALPQRPLRLRR